MKIALAITDNVKQIILTPENEYETKILSMFPEGDSYRVWTNRGFYISGCQGGWLRQYEEDKSLIICAKHNMEN